MYFIVVNTKEYMSKYLISFSRPASDAAFLGSGIGGFPAEQIKPSKQCVLSYKEALRQQVHFECDCGRQQCLSPQCVHAFRHSVLFRQGDTRKGRSQLFCQVT